MPEINYASKGVAGAGLGLGIAGASGTALWLLSGGLQNLLGKEKNCNNGDLSALAVALASISNGMGSNHTCHENTLINRYEATQQARIAELETEVKLRDANAFTMSEMGKLRDYFETKFSNVEKELCDQKVYNATNIATVNCIAGQVNQLYSLTKLVIPNTAICPGWGAVTVTTTPATATTVTPTT